MPRMKEEFVEFIVTLHISAKADLYAYLEDQTTGEHDDLDEDLRRGEILQAGEELLGVEVERA